MAEQPQVQALLATLRDALHQLECTLRRTREGVDGIGREAARLREGIEALGALQQREDTSVGIDMVIDAATDLFRAFHDLALALPDAQGDVNTLAAAIEDDENGQKA